MIINLEAMIITEATTTATTIKSHKKDRGTLRREGIIATRPATSSPKGGIFTFI